MNAPVEEEKIVSVGIGPHAGIGIAQQGKADAPLKRDIQTKVKGELDQQQREHFLNQLKQIQEEQPQAQEVASASCAPNPWRAGPRQGGV